MEGVRDILTREEYLAIDTMARMINLSLIVLASYNIDVIDLKEWIFEDLICVHDQITAIEKGWA